MKALTNWSYCKYILYNSYAWLKDWGGTGQFKVHIGSAVILMWEDPHKLVSKHKQMYSLFLDVTVKLTHTILLTYGPRWKADSPLGIHYHSQAKTAFYFGYEYSI